MARPNYSFKKRQKEIKRQKKKDEKMQRRLAKKEGDIDTVSDSGEEGAPLETGGGEAESDSATDPDDVSHSPDND